MNELAVIEPTNSQLQLPLPDGTAFTSRRLTMPENLSFEAWMDVGRFLSRSGESLDFWRADHIERGRKEFGDERVLAGMEQLGFDLGDCKKAAKRSQLLWSVPRDGELSVEHHFVLAKAKLDCTGLEMWAKLARENTLTPRELQESIKKGCVTRIEPDSRDGAGGVPSWDGLCVEADIVIREIGEGWKSWPPEKIVDALRKCDGVRAFITNLQFRLREISLESKAGS